MNAENLDKDQYLPGIGLDFALLLSGVTAKELESSSTSARSSDTRVSADKVDQDQ